MLEFNLLPDVKLNYLRTKRTEHIVITVSFLVAGVALAIFVLLFLFVDVAQKVTLDDLTAQINNDEPQLESNSNLNHVLTIQNQLTALPTLESQSPTTSRLFGYLTQLVPTNATISSLDVDFTANTITVSGGADTLATVNTFVDTLKYATYNNLTEHMVNQQAFNTVVLASFGYTNTNSGASPAQYSITLNFSPTLFNSTDNVNLVIPNEITTRSVINQPTLFKAEPSVTSSSKSS